MATPPSEDETGTETATETGTQLETQTQTQAGTETPPPRGRIPDASPAALARARVAFLAVAGLYVVGAVVNFAFSLALFSGLALTGLLVYSFVVALVLGAAMGFTAARVRPGRNGARLAATIVSVVAVVAAALELGGTWTFAAEVSVPWGVVRAILDLLAIAAGVTGIVLAWREVLRRGSGPGGGGGVLGVTQHGVDGPVGGERRPVGGDELG